MKILINTLKKIKEKKRKEEEREKEKENVCISSLELLYLNSFTFN